MRQVLIELLLYFLAKITVFVLHILQQNVHFSGHVLAQFQGIPVAGGQNPPEHFLNGHRPGQCGTLGHKKPFSVKNYPMNFCLARAKPGAAA